MKIYSKASSYIDSDFTALNQVLVCFKDSVLVKLLSRSQLIKNTNFFLIDWNDFESTSLPLYYLVASLLLPSNEILYFRLLALIISFSVPIILYFSLFAKSQLIKKVDAALLSSLVLLSSSFRTDTFFALEENIGFLILSLVILFFNRFQNNKNIINQLFLIFFSSLIFYTRQTYAFVTIIVFFELVDLKKILSKKNIYISDIEYCPFHINAIIKKYRKNSQFRKPGNLMIKKIKKKWGVISKKAFMIGDQLSDYKAAKKSGIYFEYVENDILKQVKRINKKMRFSNYF